ncbi:hypothetical protein GDO78_012363 [Eleutherodactylus coqui]|uniref:Uncharacterized protein n=1 Tax=Eleutherodactylus coqui TaxID=57060 RepID=A0A8J6K3U1_ELECQ|nr:hypothetical protein GDO78_012363 [Eleutherodactylus coqui]
MSKITKLFKSSGGSGSSSRSRKGGPSPQEALFRLRETEEMLTKKQEYLEKKIEQELATARRHGTKNKRGKWDLDKIDELMLDIHEQQDVAQEISNAISNPAGFGEEFDEDDLLAELEELEQEDLNKHMANVTLPSVPSKKLPSKPASTRKRVEDDDDMKMLSAWATY